MNAIILSVLLSQAVVWPPKEKPQETEQQCNASKARRDDCFKNYGGKIPKCWRSSPKDEWAYHCVTPPDKKK
jgi:hypothetical protein